MSASLAPAAGNAKLAHGALFLLAAVDASGYSVIAPVAPALAGATGAGPALIGALVASFPLGMIAGFVIAAPAVKRGRTTALLCASLAVIAVGCLGFIFSHALVPWFAARLVMGLGSGGLWMGIIFATLERWPGREYVYMSRVIAAYSVGGLVGPGIGALGGVRAPFAAYLVLLGLAGAGVLALRGPSRPQRFSSDRTALRLPGFWTASAAGGFAVLVLGIVDGVLPLHLAEQLDQHEIGVLYAAVSALAGVSAAVAALGRPRPLILAACGLGVGGLAIAGSSSTPIVWIGARALTAIGAGLGNTGAIGLLFEAVGTERIVTAMIVWSQIGILGYLVGPLAGGVVAESAGYGAIAVVPLLVAVPVAAAPAAARFRNRAA